MLPPASRYEQYSYFGTGAVRGIGGASQSRPLLAQPHMNWVPASCARAAESGTRAMPTSAVARTWVAELRALP